jgi:hypothetical protein
LVELDAREIDSKEQAKWEEKAAANDARGNARNHDDSFVLTTPVFAEVCYYKL